MSYNLQRKELNPSQIKRSNKIMGGIAHTHFYSFYGYRVAVR